LLDFLDPAKEYLFNKGVATSKRIASIFTDKKDMLAAFELLYALPGAPVMYYGDEIGMRNLPVTVGIVDTRKYVRGPFDWVEAERQEEDPSSLLVEVRRVIANRNTSL
jgi:glycosidase